jgi:hypothetical protein
MYMYINICLYIRINTGRNTSIVTFKYRCLNYDYDEMSFFHRYETHVFHKYLHICISINIYICIYICIMYTYIYWGKSWLYLRDKVREGWKHPF